MTTGFGPRVLIRTCDGDGAVSAVALKRQPLEPLLLKQPIGEEKVALRGRTADAVVPHGEGIACTGILDHTNRRQNVSYGNQAARRYIDPVSGTKESVDHLCGVPLIGNVVHDAHWQRHTDKKAGKYNLSARVFNTHSIYESLLESR